MHGPNALQDTATKICDGAQWTIYYLLHEIGWPVCGVSPSFSHRTQKSVEMCWAINRAASHFSVRRLMLLWWPETRQNDLPQTGKATVHARLVCSACTRFPFYLLIYSFSHPLRSFIHSLAYSFTNPSILRSHWLINLSEWLFVKLLRITKILYQSWT